MSSSHKNWLSNFLYFTVDDARRVNREVNRITREAVNRTYNEMYGEGEKVAPFYRYYAVWVQRSAFYNFLSGRGGMTVDRCLGVLYSNKELRIAMGLDPDDLPLKDWDELCNLRLSNGLRDNLLAWLGGTTRYGILSAPPQASGITSKEPNSFVLLPKATESESET